MEVLYLSKTLYFRGKVCQLAVLTFNNSPINHLVALKCSSVWELVISVILNSVGKPQPTCGPCFNRWTWQSAGHMAAYQYALEDILSSFQTAKYAETFFVHFTDLMYCIFMWFFLYEIDVWC